MLQSLLTACIFFGLFMMILPSEKRSEWIVLLLICVLLVALISRIPEFEFPSVSISDTESDLYDALPESAALENAVSDQVYRLTGRYPVSVVHDLTKREGQYSLGHIEVVLDFGEEKEVENALRSAFSFEEIFVRKDVGSPSGLPVLPQE